MTSPNYKGRADELAIRLGDANRQNYEERYKLALEFIETTLKNRERELAEKVGQLSWHKDVSPDGEHSPAYLIKGEVLKLLHTDTNSKE